MKPLKTLALLACGLLPALPIAAQTLPDDLVRAELRPGWQTEAGTRMVALHLVMAPGWKTYWRAPGEAGIPPSFDWTGSDNLGAVAFHWPRPKVVEISGYRTLVYPDELVLPIEVTPADPTRPVTLAARIDLGICENVCVQASVTVAAPPLDTTTPDPLIQAALAAAPDDAAALGLGPARCTTEPTRDGMRLTATLPLAANGADFAVVELTDQPVWVAPVETRTGASMVQVADLVPPDAKPFALTRSAVRVTAFADGEVIEFNGCKG